MSLAALEKVGDARVHGLGRDGIDTQRFQYAISQAIRDDVNSHARWTGSELGMAPRASELNPLSCEGITNRIKGRESGRNRGSHRRQISIANHS